MPERPGGMADDEEPDDDAPDDRAHDAADDGTVPMLLLLLDE